jgi:hypothetical protein
VEGNEAGNETPRWKRWCAHHRVLGRLGNLRLNGNVCINIGISSKARKVVEVREGNKRKQQSPTESVKDTVSTTLPISRY